MKSLSLLLLIIFVFSTSAYSESSETQLEKLWTLAKQNNADLYIADFAIENANISLVNKKSLYPVTLNSNLASSFSDMYEDVVWYTTNANGVLSFSKENSFGNVISGSISYGISRGILNIFAESVDRENIGYSHSPAVSLSMAQSLFPAFLQGAKYDPNLELLRKNLEVANYSKDAKEQSLIENITQYYIQQRCTLRLLEKYERYLELYDAKIEAAKKLLDENQIAFSEIWELESKRWEYYEAYNNTLTTQDNIGLTLKHLCGIDIGDISLDELLPKSEKSLFSYNPSEVKISLEIDQLRIQNILEKQSFAPVLKLGVSFSESTKTKKSLNINFIEDKSYFDWSFSVGISFSNFLSPKNKLRKELYQNNLAILEKQKSTLKNQKIEQKAIYQDLIKSYENQKNVLYEVICNKKRYLRDFEIMYETGNCSELELKEVQLSLFESEINYANLKDNLWLCKWKEAQCK